MELVIKKMSHNGIFSLSFPEAKTIIVSGDIHGDFNQLVFKLCIQYQLTDTSKRKSTMNRWLDEMSSE